MSAAKLDERGTAVCFHVTRWCWYARSDDKNFSLHCRGLSQVSFLHRANHRTVEVRRDLWQLSDLIPLLKQGQSMASYPGQCPGDFGYHQKWQLHNLPVQLLPVLSYIHSEKLCPDVRMEPFAFWFVLVTSGPGTGYSLFPSSLHFLLDIYVHW